MNNCLKLIIAIVFIAFLGFVVRKFFFLSEEDRIRGKLSDIEDVLTFNGVSHPLSVLRESRKFGEFFSQGVSFRVNTRQLSQIIINGRDEAMGKFLIGRRALKKCDVDFVDEAITVKGKSATARLTARAEATDSSGDLILETVEMKIHFKNIEDEWLIFRVEGTGFVNY